MNKSFMMKILNWRPSAKFWTGLVIFVIAVVAAFIFFPMISSFVAGFLLLLSGHGKGAAEKYIDDELEKNEEKRKKAGVKAAEDRTKLDKKEGDKAHDAANDILRN